MSEENGNPPVGGNEFNLTGTGRDQVDALKLFAYSRAIPGAPKPRLKLPGDNVQIGGFAKSFWTLVRERGVFRRDVHVVLVNEVMQRLDFMDGHMVQNWGDDVVDCFKVRAQKGPDDTINYTEAVRSMPVDVARGLLAGVRVNPDLIAGVDKMNYAPMPILRRNGDVELLRPGYDIDAKTFTFDAGFRLDEELTAHDAVIWLRTFFRQFPFGDGIDSPERSLSVQIACMLTLFAGGLLSPGSSRPMFIFNANAQRSGKSLLSKVALLSVFGNADSSSWSENKEEFRKALETSANSAVPYIFFDNVRMHMANADLERFVTSPSVTCRVMGKNTELITVANVATVLITANQATASTDIAERSLFVNLFVNEADPQARKIQNPIKEPDLKTPENRRQMLSALWAIVKHWVADGKPLNRETRLVGFEEWSEVIGGIVRYAGFADPLARPNIAGVGDTAGQRMKDLVTKLFTIEGTGQDLAKPHEFEEFTLVSGGREFAFGQLTKVCANSGLFDDHVPDDGEMKASDRSKFGKYLKKYIGRGRVFTIGTGVHAKRVELRWNGEDGRAKRYVVTELPSTELPA